MDRNQVSLPLSSGTNGKVLGSVALKLRSFKGLIVRPGEGLGASLGDH